MANFWAGVGQGFSQGFEKSWDAAARRRERKEDREQALKDRQAAWDREKAKRDEETRGEIAALLGAENLPLGGGADYVPTDLEGRMHSISQAKAQRLIREKEEERMRNAEAIAAGQGAVIPPVGVRAPGMTPADILRLGAEQEKADKIAEDKRRNKAAIELQKSKLGLETGAETVKDKKDLVGGILSKYGQLGDKTPTPDFDALMLMSSGQLRKLDGGLDTRLAERKAMQPTASDRVIMDALKLANPQASPAQLAKLLLAHKENKGDYFELRDPETGNLIFSKGQKSTSTSKDDAPEPSEYDNAILMLKQMKDRFDPKNPSVGWVATAKSIIGDDILPQFQIKSLADEDRRKYQQLVGEFGVTYTKALNAPDSRLSDMDVLRLEKLAPKKTDSPFAFQAKIQEIDDKLRTLQRFRTAYGKDINIWEMDWRDVLDARKRATPEQESLINDDLAAFILQESHGLKGSSEEGFIKSLGEKARKGEINADEYKFWMRSVFPKR